MKNYSLFVSDLDGTLVPSDDPVLDDEVVDLINGIRSSGMKFTIATGRKFTSIYPYLRKLNVSLPVILFNGARIVDTVEGKIIHEKHFEKKTAEILISRFKMIPSIFFFDELVFHTFLTEAVKEYFEHDGIRVHHPLGDEVVEDHKLTKIMIVGEKEVQLAHDVIEDMRVNHFMSEKNCLEILPDEADKGEALKVLCEYLGLKLHEVISVGDGQNDEKMIEFSGLGIRIDEHADVFRVLQSISCTSS